MPFPEKAFNLGIKEISEHICRQNCNPKSWIIQFLFLLPRHSSDVFNNLYNRKKKDGFYNFIIVIVKYRFPVCITDVDNTLENIDQGHVFWKRRNNILTSFFKHSSFVFFFYHS